MTTYRLRFFGPIFLGILFTAVFTWPLALKINTFYTDKGDYPLVGWILWHNQRAITEGFIFDQVKYFDAGQLYPYPFSLAYSEHLFIPSILFTIIYTVTKSAIFSTNILFFFSFVLSFTSSYLVINYFLKNKQASIIGALIFTFNPLTFAHFADHFHLLNKYFLPPLFLYCYLFLSNPNFKNAILFFSFFTLNFLTSIHFGIFSLVINLVLIVAYLVVQLVKKNYQYILNLVKFSILVFLFLPILVYFNQPYLEFSSKEKIIRPLSEIVYYSARLIDFVSPHPDNLIYGQFYKMMEGYRNPRDENNYFNYSEHTLFTNIFPSFLFLAGLYFSIRLLKSKDELITRSAVLFFLGVFILSFILSLGPQFMGWNDQGGPLILPYFLLYKLFPILGAVRVPTRFEFILYISFSFFTALGIYFIQKRIRRKLKLPMFLIFLSLIFIENISIFPFNEKSQVFEKFNNESYKKQLSFLKDKNTIHIPVGFNNDQNEARYLNWAAITEERIFNGYSGYAPADRNDFIKKIKDIDNKSYERIYAIGIDYIIFHKSLISDFENVYTEKEIIGEGKTFEDNEIMIIDLKKYKFRIQKCKNNKDLFVQLISAPFLMRGKVKVKNMGSCYYVSQYRDRYLPIKPNSREDTTYIKLPVLIDPGEEIVYAI